MIHSENGLALVLRGQGRHVAADSLYRHVIAVRRRVIGPAHPALAVSLTQLGELRAERGDVVAAESLFVQALAMRRALLDESHPLIAESLRQLAELRARPAAARPMR